MAQRPGENVAQLDAVADAASAQKTTMKWSRYQVALVAVLLLVAVCNYLDRGILAVLQEPIKRELGLSDWQLGLLGGPAFALFYALAGLPLARLAERVNRGRLLGVCVAVWSGMTALCGAAQNFIQLALCRFGVGAGEGGSLPISHSLVADNFGVRQRGFVLSILSAAPSIAGILTPIIGAVVAQLYGWRIAFLAVGLPGVIVALLTWFTIRDRRTEAGERARIKRSFVADMGWLVRNRAFVFLFVAGSFTGMGVYSISLFEVSFMMRSHGLSLAQAGTVKGVLGVAGVIGTFIGGWMADRYADDRGRSYVIVPAISAGLACVLYVLAFSQPILPAMLVLIVLADMAYNIKNGPMFAAVQNIVPGHMRATGAAVFMVAATVVGSTVGAPMVGATSDLLASRHFPSELGAFATSCVGGRAIDDSAPALVAACEFAVAEGLRHALMLVTVVFALAALCLVISAKTIRISTPEDSLPPEPSK